MSDDAILKECTGLVSALIRNRCVNDGTSDEVGETTSAELLGDHLDGAGLRLELVEPEPGRGSLIATLPGHEGPAGGLTLLGHTDVVPADEQYWSVPPFEGIDRDGAVWGRGAIDMLGMTASMAVALRHLAVRGFRPRHDLTFCAVADEEAGGRLGAGWIARHRPEHFRDRSVLTESGGFPLPTDQGTKLECFVGEKGTLGCTVRIRGTPGHGAYPYRTDNVLMKLPEVLDRLRGYAPGPRLDALWRRYAEGMALPTGWLAGLSTVDTFDKTLDRLPVGLARHFHSVTRTTMTPTIVRAGGKKNVIPSTAEIHLDVRVFPGETRQEVEAALSGLFTGCADVHLEFYGWRDGAVSAAETPLWSTLQETVDELMPGARMVPALSSATTDGRWVRPFGSPCYGFGLFGTAIPAEEYFAMFHGVDERIDHESLLLLRALWIGVAERMA
ncbi:M20/M25/M40 family metallo-hydrolase [Amycolatopsis sp., V23-08]|uniref:M20/M25/M40 family metallo-hydrolase n=1 Tax=Amycolatopsis heterodermiae TaxID=3110235 RepID=A0ABU5RA11_9PSEU|nr:M20/M25/M40 family metallo-hydrolase [Amycolatopsis sp., V23-08]MEA5362609.1 M20/M25/M40 family metallo-hydrolase [Amycolatopsis sp., V23-08]